MIDMIYYDEVA